MRPVYQRYFVVACCPAMGGFVKPVLNVVLCAFMTSFSWLTCSLLVSPPLPITRFVNGKPPKH